jgi:hypothetical protein
MLIYQPYMNSTSRVSWRGGESTQLHYEELYRFTWRAIDVRTLGGGIPPACQICMQRWWIIITTAKTWN